MKQAVAYLTPFIEAEGGEDAGSKAGTVLLATVKGDVHDIGKNIVGVVLGCSNYEIIDLGVMVPAQTILETARDRNVDVIGLSGLITPSLDEMVRVAGEMERTGFQVPLLIGGATTSRLHTSLKIDPAYHGPVVHVADASRASGVISNLMSTDLRAGFLSDLKVDYERVVASYQRANIERDRVTIDQARGQPVPTGLRRDDRDGADVHRPPRVRRLRRRRTRARTSTGHRSSVPGGSARASPRCSPIPSSPRRRDRCTTTRWRCSTRSSATTGSARRRSSGSGRRTPASATTSTTSSCTPTTRAPRYGPACTVCASRPPSRRRKGRPPEPQHLRLRRTGRLRHRRLRRRVRRHRRARGDRHLRGVRAQQRRLLLDPAQGVGRPSRRGVRRADARAGAHRAVGVCGRRALRHRPTCCPSRSVVSGRRPAIRPSPTTPRR